MYLFHDRETKAQFSCGMVMLGVEPGSSGIQILCSQTLSCLPETQILYFNVTDIWDFEFMHSVASHSI